MTTMMMVSWCMMCTRKEVQVSVWRRSKEESRVWNKIPFELYAEEVRLFYSFSDVNQDLHILRYTFSCGIFLVYNYSYSWFIKSTGEVVVSLFLNIAVAGVHNTDSPSQPIFSVLYVLQIWEWFSKHDDDDSSRKRESSCLVLLWSPTTEQASNHKHTRIEKEIPFHDLEKTWLWRPRVLLLSTFTPSSHTWSHFCTRINYFVEIIFNRFKHPWYMSLLMTRRWLEWRSECEITAAAKRRKKKHDVLLCWWWWLSKRKVVMEDPNQRRKKSDKKCRRSNMTSQNESEEWEEKERRRHSYPETREGNCSMRVWLQFFNYVVV
jgi:hypothetical protein